MSNLLTMILYFAFAFFVLAVLDAVFDWRNQFCDWCLRKVKEIKDESDV